MMMCFIILMVAILCIFTVICFAARNAEKKAFNGGICPRCGEKLQCFDMASDGSRGWTCKKCNYTTWCSYDVDGRG